MGPPPGRPESVRGRRSDRGGRLRRATSVALVVRARARPVGRGALAPAGIAASDSFGRVGSDDAVVPGRGAERLRRDEPHLLLRRDAPKLHRAATAQLGPRLQAARLAVLPRFSRARIQLFLGRECGVVPHRVVALAPRARLQPPRRGLCDLDPLLHAVRAGVVGNAPAVRRCFRGSFLPSFASDLRFGWQSPWRSSSRSGC